MWFSMSYGSVGKGESFGFVCSSLFCTATETAVAKEAARGVLGRKAALIIFCRFEVICLSFGIAVFSVFMLRGVAVLLVFRLVL